MSDKALADLYDKIEGLKASGEFNKLSDSALAALFDEVEKAKNQPDIQEQPTQFSGFKTQMDLVHGQVEAVAGAMPKTQEEAGIRSVIDRRKQIDLAKRKIDLEKNIDVLRTFTQDKEPEIAKYARGQLIRETKGREGRGAIGTLTSSREAEERYLKGESDAVSQFVLEPINTITGRLFGKLVRAPLATTTKGAELFMPPEDGLNYGYGDIGSERVKWTQEAIDYSNKSIEDFLALNPNQRINTLLQNKKELQLDKELNPDEKEVLAKINNQLIQIEDELRSAKKEKNLASTAEYYGARVAQFMDNLVLEGLGDVTTIVNPSKLLTLFKKGKISGAPVENVFSVKAKNTADKFRERLKFEKSMQDIGSEQISKVEDVTKQLPSKQVGETTETVTKTMPLPEAKAELKRINIERINNDLPPNAELVDVSDPLTGGSMAYIKIPETTVSKPGELLGTKLESKLTPKSMGKAEAEQFVKDKLGEVTGRIEQLPDPLTGKPSNAYTVIDPRTNKPFEDLITTPSDIRKPSISETMPETKITEEIKTPIFEPGKTETFKVEKVLEGESSEYRKVLEREAKREYGLAKSKIDLKERRDVERTKWSDELNQEMKSDWNFEIPDLEDIAMISKTGELKSIAETTASNMLPGYAIKATEGTLVDDLVKRFSTETDDVEMIEKSLSYVPEFNVLKKQELVGGNVNIQDFTFDNPLINKIKSNPRPMSPEQIGNLISTGKETESFNALTKTLSELNRGEIPVYKLRHLEEEINSILRDEGVFNAKGTLRLNAAQSDLFNLKREITKVRKAKMKDVLKDKYDEYEKLDTQAGKLLNDQSVLEKQLTGGLKSKNLAPGEIQPLRRKVAEEIQLKVDEVAKYGKYHNLKDQLALDVIGKRIGINNLNEQIIQMGLAKRYGLFDDAKGVSLIPSEAAIKLGKQNFKVYENLPLMTPIKFRLFAKALDLAFTGTDAIKKSNVAKMIKRLEASNKSDISTVKILFNLSTPPRIIANTYTQQEIEALRQEAKDERLDKMVNILDAAKRLISPTAPAPSVPQKLAG